MIRVLIGVLLIAVLVLIVMNTDIFKKNNKDKVTQKSNKLFFRKIKKNFNVNNESRFEETNLINYAVYNMTKSERIKYILIGMSIMFMLGFIFYRSLIISMVVSFLGVLLPRFVKEAKIKKRQNQLLLEFKDALYSIYTSLSAGISPENAIINVVSDMEDLYGESNNFIVEEFNIMKRRINLNLDIDEVLKDFSKRADIEDITNFVDVFLTSMSTGKRQGEIIKNAINNIVDKIEIKREIEIMISAKKFESRIMSVVPILLILFLSLSAPDYFEPMYTTLMGRIAMTIVVIGLIIASIIADKIMRIEV